jgi:DNA repair and recombination protein RAD54B
MPPYAGALERIGPREVEFDEKILVMLLPRLAGVAEDADAPFGAADDECEVPVPRVGVHSPVRPPAPTPAPALESPAVTSSAFSAKKFVPPVAVSFYSKPLEKAKAKGPLCVVPLFASMQLLTQLYLGRHDPDAEGAIVMKAPTKEALRKFNAKYEFITMRRQCWLLLTPSKESADSACRA